MDKCVQFDNVLVEDRIGSGLTEKDPVPGLGSGDELYWFSVRIFARKNVPRIETMAKTPDMAMTSFSPMLLLIFSFRLIIIRRISMPL